MSIGEKDVSYIELSKELKKCKRELASDLHRIKESAHTNALLVTVIHEYKEYISGVVATKSDLVGVLKKVENHLVELIANGSVNSNMAHSALSDIKLKIGKAEFDNERFKYKLCGT
jgi:hypothetical protein